MPRQIRKFGVTLGIALGISAVMLSRFPQRRASSPRGNEMGRALALASQGKVTRLYDDWVKQHERAGGDRNVVIPLGPARGHAAPASGARGLARINLLEGVIEVDATGLDADGTWEAWLVENRDGKGASALIDPDDGRIRLGTLACAGRRARLRVVLGPEAFEHFEVDLVAITRAGQPAGEPAALFGLPRTFQRMYTRARQGRLGAYAAALAPRASASARLLSEAHADGIVVDPDVLVNALVAQGAQLFINETFNGNGRTCATCHPASNNFTIDPTYIATLPPTDPLFVAETNPALANLEVPAMLRSRALILENVDGFNHPGVLRSVPHTLSLSTSISVPTCVNPAGCNFNLFGQPFNVAYGQQATFIDVTMPEASGFPALSAGPPVVAFPVERTGWGGRRRARQRVTPRVRARRRGPALPAHAPSRGRRGLSPSHRHRARRARALPAVARKIERCRPDQARVRRSHGREGARHLQHPR
jgi:hypothetical protein